MRAEPVLSWFTDVRALRQPPGAQPQSQGQKTEFLGVRPQDLNLADRRQILGILFLLGRTRSSMLIAVLRERDFDKCIRNWYLWRSQNEDSGFAQHGRQTRPVIRKLHRV
jgi:hypothetical protein